MKRKERLQTITEIIGQTMVGSQKELSKLLKLRGISVTQATLSRDLSTLGVGTVHHPEKGNIYSIADLSLEGREMSKMAALPMEAIQSLGFSGNLAVIKCQPSYAPSIAMSLDVSGLVEILGTIAGDDTVLIILSEGITKHQFQKALASRFPEVDTLVHSNSGGVS